MLYILILISSFIFYLTSWGYVYFSTYKVQKFPILKWPVWILYITWLCFFILAGMRIVSLKFEDTNKVIAIVPVAIGFITSLIVQRNLWKKHLNK